MDGSTYGIDLNEAHTTQLRVALRRYVEAARRTIKSRGKVRPVDQGRGGKIHPGPCLGQRTGTSRQRPWQHPGNVLEKYVAAR
ncbi:histone-like nucleoid-structuring protein Lsr2 [Arthrobacter sp. UYEF20]|uniref:Lsr2 dimerization domain-containing protein n=1 Tax=Arthrobacter sp. UYEF20 TaxID=1756363 RepID=UPI003397AC31